MSQSGDELHEKKNVVLWDTIGEHEHFIRTKNMFELSELLHHVPEKVNFLQLQSQDLAFLSKLLRLFIRDTDHWKVNSWFLYRLLKVYLRDETFALCLSILLAVKQNSWWVFDRKMRRKKRMLSYLKETYSFLRVLCENSLEKILQFSCSLLNYLFSWTPNHLVVTEVIWLLYELLVLSLVRPEGINI